MTANTKTKRKRRAGQHYLVTVYVQPSPLHEPPPFEHLHAYLKTSDERDVNRVSDKLMKVAEERGCQVLPIVLQTTLTTGAEFVRGIVRNLGEEVRQNLAEDTPFHMTIFALPVGSAQDKQLMALH